MARPALKREVVQYIVSHYGLKMRRACRLMQQTRNVQYYLSVKDPQLALRSRMHDLARTRVRYGYRRIYILLKREGWRPGISQVYRVYREERLQLRAHLPKRRKMVVTREAKIQPTRINAAWSMDFVADQLADGTRFRSLTIIDVFSKAFRDECLNLHWFADLEEAQAIIEAWRQDYNESRPHSTLKGLAPAEFARRSSLAAAPPSSLAAKN
ncbi:hypothetical protein ACZ75_01115 [Massilia sp. NR 4-1]|nr:hypothetical protein ACZ75_01115 [Massilia sp. NR 4-1]